MNIYHSATVASQVDANEETVINYINANPGKTQAEIVAATGVNATAVRYIVDLWGGLGGIVARNNAVATTVYYAAGDWSVAIYAQRANARQWVKETGTFAGYNNMGKSESQMVSDFAAEGITIAFEVASALFRMLQQEGLAEIA